MKKTQKIRYIALGCLLTLVINLAVTPALATLLSQTIEVYTGVDIYIDDIKLYPEDANGNAVEPFVYNGTTYLPVRAISEGLGKPVTWDGATSTVYIGAHDSDEPAVLLNELTEFSGYGISVSPLYTVTDNTGISRENCISTNFNKYFDSIEGTYYINGQYSKIAGVYFQSETGKNETDVSLVEIYGDGKLLKSMTMTGGEVPIEFEVDLTGVLELRVVLDSGNKTSRTNEHAFISNFGLYT